MKIIKFKPKYEDMYKRGTLFDSEYYCEITEKLDEISGITRKILRSKGEWSEFYRHYILIDKLALNDKELLIRIPGGTLGCIKYNEKNIITDIHVDTGYVVKTYPIGINETLKDLYIGAQIDFGNIKGDYNE